MENPNETQKAPAPEAVKADQETLAHSIQEDELQDMLQQRLSDCQRPSRAAFANFRRLR